MAREAGSSHLPERDMGGGSTQDMTHGQRAAGAGQVVRGAGDVNEDEDGNEDGDEDADGDGKMGMERWGWGFAHAPRPRVEAVPAPVPPRAGRGQFKGGGGGAAGDGGGADGRRPVAARSGAGQGGGGGSEEEEDAEELREEAAPVPRGLHVHLPAGAHGGAAGQAGAGSGRSRRGSAGAAEPGGCPAGGAGGSGPPQLRRLLWAAEPGTPRAARRPAEPPAAASRGHLAPRRLHRRQNHQKVPQSAAGAAARHLDLPQPRHGKVAPGRCQRVRAAASLLFARPSGLRGGSEVGLVAFGKGRDAGWLREEGETEGAWPPLTERSDPKSSELPRRVLLLKLLSAGETEARCRAIPPHFFPPPP